MLSLLNKKKLALGLIILSLTTLMCNKPAAETKTEAAKNDILVESNNSFEETVMKIKKDLTARKIHLFHVIDQAKAAKDSSLMLRPTKILIFGNPKAGTPLMIKNPKISIDLPLKMLVYEENGKTFIYYKDFVAIAKEYGLENDPTTANIVRLLDAISKNAAIKS